MKIHFGECEACAVREKEITLLKELMDRMAKEHDIERTRLAKDREIERAEYKRSVDALLTVLKAPMIGQGSDEHKKPLDVKELLGFMDEPGEDRMESRHPDKVVNKVE